MHKNDRSRVLRIHSYLKARGEDQLWWKERQEILPLPFCPVSPVEWKPLNHMGKNNKLLSLGCWWKLVWASHIFWAQTYRLGVEQDPWGGSASKTSELSVCQIRTENTSIPITWLTSVKELILVWFQFTDGKLRAETLNPPARKGKTDLSQESLALSPCNCCTVLQGLCSANAEGN